MLLTANLLSEFEQALKTHACSFFLNFKTSYRNKKQLISDVNIRPLKRSLFFVQNFSANSCKKSAYTQ